MAPKRCRRASQAFFDCFSEKGKQPEGGNQHAGREALEACKALLDNYSKCLDKHAKLEFHRVQEEYRLRN